MTKKRATPKATLPPAEEFIGGAPDLNEESDRTQEFEKLFSKTKKK